MSVAKARENLQSARRNLADAIDALPSKSLLFRTRIRSKRNKIKRTIDTIDRTLENLRGL